MAEKKPARPSRDGAPKPRKPAEDDVKRVVDRAERAQRDEKREARGAKPDPKGSAEKRPRSAKGKPARKAIGGWRRWVAIEAGVLVAGVAVGAGIFSAIAWSRANRDVDAFLQAPHTARPGTVWSAPMLIREGMVASPSEIAAELLAAGYDKVPTVTGTNQFRIEGSTLDIATAAWKGPGLEVPASRARVTVATDGRVVDVEPGDSVVLHPTTLAVIGDPATRRDALAIDQLSPMLPKAVIAVEDQRFHNHPGLDPIGIGRALWHNVRNDGSPHGGSTLTQQLAKNLFLSSERSLQRKVREAFFAVALEHRLSKKEILALYLEEVYLGQAGGVPLYGVEAASRAWFGVSAANLDLGEAATVAGVISSPNQYSPLKHPEVAVERRDLALRRMVETGAVSAAEADAAKAKPLVIDGLLPGAVRRAPWAVDEAVAIAERTLGEGAMATGGWQVYTTLQPLLQRAAERAVRDGLAEVEHDYPKAVGAEAALVAIRADDGAVVALVGGRDYAKSSFDRATDAWREVGSTSKALLLLAALDADPKLGPNTKLWDSPIVREIDGKPWSPANYDGRFRGEVTLRQAIEGSLNVPAVRLSEVVGLDRAQKVARDAGLSKASKLPSAALGAFPATPWEVAGAYTAFPGEGTVRTPRLVAGIADADGATRVVFGPEKHAVASARAAALATSILRGVVTDGTGARAAAYGVTGPVGGKSGTTNDYRDAWFTGFTPEIVATVWVGRDRGANLGLAGSRAALPTWARFLVDSGAIRGGFERPTGLVEATLCAESHRVARPECPRSYGEIFPADGVPDGKCDQHGGPVVSVGNWLGNLLEAPKTPPDPSAPTTALESAPLPTAAKAPSAPVPAPGKRPAAPRVRDDPTTPR